METASKSDIVRARIQPKVKRDAESILKRLGVSHSTFINMSYRAVVEAGGIPFSLHVPNAKTAKVLREARVPSKRKAYARADSLAGFAKSLGIKPKT
jgi:DNA-damage-inducible protein J